ncbi:hypothetical protein [Streptomyces sp. NBC_00887]|uniref:hypothetical protein n=1 Tax=Streptomyces sp. NBC_00887 TaxID=2975859 RepID=UPI003868C261|nr:hypothetical protein OG844_02010 [Streptomyces sp. NBC_00887]WSY36091.1 hypothetical protein OG844_43590 [Streptomyces sp. NBC_00887]
MTGPARANSDPRIGVIAAKRRVTLCLRLRWAVTGDEHGTPVLACHFDTGVLNAEATVDGWYARTADVRPRRPLNRARSPSLMEAGAPPDTGRGQTTHMKLPAEALAATALLEVVRISDLPTKRGTPYPGSAGAHWIGSEAVSALALIESLPGSEQHRCGFLPGWSVRAYADTLDLVLFEAAFCFSCYEVRMQGTAVPPALATQFFDAGAPQAHALLERFREAAP